jgi:Xaa-Pro aminopeptidase
MTALPDSTAMLLTPPDFTADDYARRMARTTAAAADAGLAGVLVAPGPDLVWLTGYHPTAITERLTLLVLSPDREPTLVVPALERPDAEGAAGVAATSVLDWTDGSDPYPMVGSLLRPDGRYGVSDSAWALHILALEEHLPDSSYTALTNGMPRFGVRIEDIVTVTEDGGLRRNNTSRELRSVN